MRKLTLTLWGGVLAGALALGLVASHPSTVNAASGCTQYVFAKYSSGTCVKYIQIMLNNIPIVQPKLATDGLFGSKTQFAVKQYQSDPWYEAGPPVDGIVGPKTWRSLCGMNIRFAQPGGYAYNAAVSAGCLSIL